MSYQREVVRYMEKCVKDCLYRHMVTLDLERNVINYPKHKAH